MYYRPKYKQGEPKYTHGDEYMLFPAMTDYVGFYYIDTNGVAYSEAEYVSGRTVELIKKITPLRTNKDTRQYYVQTRKAFLNKDQPVYHIPIVTENDITHGYMKRYVAQKRNELNIIIEISKEQFRPNALPYVLYNLPGIDTNIWTMDVIQWTIVGKPDDIVKANKKVLLAAETTLPGISNFFTDLNEFMRV